jgi:hypothetical protein|tara:strand:+ start:1248 stop:1628 length:381 start_codon:yes stop_codon:yes gene_type:complete
MNGWSAKSVGLANVQVSGVATNRPVTVEFPNSAGGALNGIIKLVVSGVTQVGTITPKLQTANGNDWVDVKSGAAITAAGIQYIRWNIEVAGDQAVLPLLNKCRVVVTTTNAGDIVTVDLCEVLQEL